MADTAIEWTDSAGLETSSRVTCAVVPRHESSGTPLAVEQLQLRSTATPAYDCRIRLTKTAQISPRPVFGVVSSPRHDFQVLRSVVELVLIPMMNHLTPAKWSAEHLRRHQSVLVDVPTRVGHRVPSRLNKPVAAACQSSPALPIDIVRTKLRTSHKMSVANRTEQVQ